MSKVFALLKADGPDPDLAAEQIIYAPLIGSWDVIHRTFALDGSVTEREGEWHFAWILGGRGVQDVLFAKGAPPGARNTAIRCYDESIDAWRVTAMQSIGGEFVSLVARRSGDKIVQHGAAHDGSTRERWTFSELTADSFRWTGESSPSASGEWKLHQEMRATRQRRETAAWDEDE
jgi:hypothetical protein